MASEWDKLREFDGQVENAFEELCAQLARAESTAKNWTFDRNGKPDGGLECFATRRDGSQVGWQAKWFRHPPKTNQWRQLTDSFKSALDTYPSLTEFIVCLPLDRSNSGGKRQLTMEQWTRQTGTWAKHASSKSRSVTFACWGTSELFERLSRVEHGGRRKYWFDRDCLPPGWFRSRFEEAWSNNSRRYRPKLHIDVPPTRWFGPLLQTPGFMNEARAAVGAVCRAINDLVDRTPRAALGSSITALQGAAKQLAFAGSALPTAAEAEFKCEDINAFLLRVQQSVDTVSLETSESDETKLRHWHSNRSVARQAVTRLASFTNGLAASLNRARAMLILGDAGAGKTHLLFKEADERTRLGLPTVVLCGLQFARGDPWAQIITSLGLTCSRDEFLGAMTAAAEAARCRALIVIDALNESEDSSVWTKALPGMLTALRGYPMVAFALSTRVEFAEAVVSESIDTAMLPRVLHQGFAGLEETATARIFQHYEIATPDVPLLNPEFSNPLFVLTLAEAMFNAGLKTLPRGSHPVEWVFGAWLDGINEKLASRGQLDFDVGEQRVQKAVAGLADEMATRGTRVLPKDVARRIVDGVPNATPWSRSLLRAMISEEIIQKTSMLGGPGSPSPVDVLRFTFDRFADHSIVQSLLKGIKNRAALARVLRDKGPLRSRLVRSSRHGVLVEGGLLNALAIVLPADKRFRCELSAVLKGAAIASHVRRAVTRSVQWRDPVNISREAVSVFRRSLEASQKANLYDQRAVLVELLQLAIRPDHPLNADFLDAHLRTQPMASRDYGWSRPLALSAKDDPVVMRLVDWMATPAAASIDDETVRLAVTVAAWLCATPNRVVRDRATKAIVAMLVGRPSIAAALVEHFLNVDDLYVVERVLAAAYGVALRTPEPARLRALGQRVYDRCFAQPMLPVHLVARDYARRIVEHAQRQGGLKGIDVTVLSPPYRSSWPTKISRHTDWDRRFAGRSTKWSSRTAIEGVWYSIRDGDFGHEVIGSQAAWLRYPLRARIPRELTRPDPRGIPLGHLEDLVAAGQRVSPGGASIDEYASPTRRGAHPKHLTRSELEHRSWFPINQIQCMVMDEVLALGFVDRLEDGLEAPDTGRGLNSNRMRAKYQWIAYWTTLARIADRFQFRGHEKLHKEVRYTATWQVRDARDIDPSCLLRRKVSGHFAPYRPVWWAPFAKTDFDRRCSDIEWLKDQTRVPRRADICEVCDGTGGSWIVGHLFADLRADPDDLGMPETRERRIWYATEAVFVRSRDSARLVKWLNVERRKPNVNGNGLLPERPHLWTCLLREFPESAAYEAEAIPFFHREPWRVDKAYGAPVGCSILADGYFDDRRDGSQDEVLEFFLPSEEVVRGLKLRHGMHDGHFENLAGQLVAWDPSITNSGPTALLLERTALLNYARDKDYHIVQLVYGEQRASSTDATSREYLGQLLFSGVFVCDGSGWTGAVDARFEPPPNQQRARAD